MSVGLVPGVEFEVPRARARRVTKQSAVLYRRARAGLPRRATQHSRRRPAAAGALRCYGGARDGYLMNSISEYFGSGHRSSATSFSSRSATSRTSSIAGDHRVAHVHRPPSAAEPSGGSRRGSRPRASSSAKCSSLTSGSTSPTSSSRPLALQFVEVAHRRRQHHRARDRRRRLGLDVDVDHVLLGEHLVARLELALGEHLVLLERRRPSICRPATAARRASCAGSPGRASRPPRATPPSSCRRRRRPACWRVHASLTTLVTAFSSVAPERFERRLQLVGQLVDRLGDDRVQHRVRAAPATGSSRARGTRTCCR